MFQRLVTRIAAIGLVGSLLVFSVACGGSDTVPDEPVTDEQPDQQERTVVLYQYRFNPTSLEVESGTTVVFQNRDAEPHNINIPALNVDQNIEPNQEWSYTFETQGEFAVGNRFSDGMKLDIVVE